MKYMLIILLTGMSNILSMGDTIVIDIEDYTNYHTMPKISITELIDDQITKDLADLSPPEEEILKKMDDDDIKKEIDRIEKEQQQKRKDDLKKTIAIIAGVSTISASIVTGMTLIIINYF
jgi:hypothetical protein